MVPGGLPPVRWQKGSCVLADRERVNMLREETTAECPSVSMEELGQLSGVKQFASTTRKAGFWGEVLPFGKAFAFL